MPNFPTSEEDEIYLSQVAVEANIRNVDSRKRAATSSVQTSSRKKTPTNRYLQSGLVNHASHADDTNTVTSSGSNCSSGRYINPSN